MTVDEPITDRRETRPDVSVVVPVFNEEASLAELVDRVVAVAEAAGWRWELVCVLDGCTDRSREVLAQKARPELVVVEMERNVGQHAAIFEGLRRAQGRAVAMLDADLQNPPEELPTVVDALLGGVDAVSSWRSGRQDAAWRRLASRAFNLALGRLVSTPGRDIGCMLRAYDRAVIERFLASGEAPRFMPVQLARRARRSVDVAVRHAPRVHGESNYDARRLIHLLGDVLRARFVPAKLPPDDRSGTEGDAS